MRSFQDAPSCMLVISEEEKNYAHRIAPAFSGVRVKAYTGEILTITELVQKAKRNGLTSIVTSRADILEKLLPLQNSRKKPSIANYAGSLFTWGDMEIVIINPLKQLISVPYGEFICKRYVSKVTHRNKWRRTSQFNFKIVEDQHAYLEAKEFLEGCDLIAVDSETIEPNLIRCVGYCGVRLATGETRAFVLPVKSYADVLRIRELNWLQVPKVLQNGKYDCAYFAAWNVPLWGYFFDTKTAYHSWYSELPKDLAYITAFFVRDSMYWKDLAQTSDIQEYYRYNALDCWGTLESWLAWCLEAPAWAKKNYVRSFTQMPICHMMEMTGIKQNEEKLIAANKEITAKMEAKLSFLKNCISPNFNPSSPPQVLRLMHALGYRKAEDTVESTIKEASYVHPLNELILSGILDYRGLRKLVSTYVPIGFDKKGERLNKDFRGRILYSISTDQTDTSRCASKEHHFWCGLQIQNIPREDAEAGLVKGTMEADEDYELYEFDFSQAEARGVAYKSGDEALLAAVESARDFHSVNASAFFGVPYEKIFDDATRKTLDKKLRDLSKRTNHGANYNMGPAVMLETMGSKKVREAQKLLKLQSHLGLIEVCTFLLKVYERTYPRVKTTYYSKIKKDIATSSLLVGDTGLVRYCFGNPSANKPALNSYVAHVTQSLNAMNLNEAMLRLFRKYGFDNRVKFIAQIHDSFLCQIRKGPWQATIAEDIKNIMTFGVPVTDCLGIKRIMTVPVDVKCHGQFWHMEGHD